MKLTIVATRTYRMYDRYQSTADDRVPVTEAVRKAGEGGRGMKVHQETRIDGICARKVEQ